MKFCTELYQLQLEGGRYFLHEHPLTAASWNLGVMRKLLAHPEVGYVTADMCQFGMQQESKNGEILPIMKPTRWLSNSPYILNILSRRCARDHHHQVLIGGRAQQAQVYPEALCCCILKGLRRQLNADGVLSNRFVGSIDPEEENLSDVMNEYSDTWGEYYDVSGNALESSRVREARAEEIQGLTGRGTYTKVPIADCWAKTGKGPIQTRFVDLNKGVNKNPVYRSRWVAIEVRANNPNTEMFAGMPPLEAKKALFSMAATKSLS